MTGPDTTNAEPPLLRRDQGQLTTLVLNRPAARNSLTLALLEALQGQLDAIAGDGRISVVVIAANGPAFCAGHDLKELRAEASEDFYRAAFEASCRMMMSIVRLPQPVIARVHGVATAAGCQLVASCDLAVASENARFATPGVDIGLFCSTPMVALSRNVPRKRAMEMLLTGEPIGAREALEYGLVNRVVPEDRLDAEVAELAEIICAKPRGVVALGKKAFYRQIEMDLAASYSYAAEVMTRNMLEPDAGEGIGAFLEKRDPRWSQGG